MKKSVWLINQYLTTPDLNGDQHRHSSLAEQWKKKGYDVTLITSSFSHVPYRENKIKGLYKVENHDIRTLLIKGNKYKNTQGVSRLISWLVFSFLLFFIPTKKIPKPDIIIVSSISLLPILNVVYFFKKKFKNVKFILEIRDIWPLTIVELGGYSQKNLLVKILGWIEKKGYQKADHIVSLLINANIHIENIIKKAPKNYSWISNGYALNSDIIENTIQDKLDLKIPKDKFIIGYAGTLGNANLMDYVIEAVKNLAKENICLCILGGGVNKENLINQSKNNENIVFLDKVKKDQVPFFLQKCDILYSSLHKFKVYEFGISANKLFDYMFVAKPIIFSASTKDNVIELANCGKIIEPENVKEIEKQILEYKKMNNKERQQVGKNGKEYLLKHFTYQKLASKYITIFESF